MTDPEIQRLIQLISRNPAELTPEEIEVRDSLLNLAKAVATADYNKLQEEYRSKEKDNASSIIKVVKEDLKSPQLDQVDKDLIGSTITNIETLKTDTTEDVLDLSQRVERLRDESKLLIE